jgi:hypothetical protein
MRDSLYDTHAFRLQDGRDAVHGVRKHEFNGVALY